jgi:anti-sigma factor RsiW
VNEHVTADLSAYLDEELAPAERALVSAHLEGCGRCSAQLADLRATATLMAALPSAKPSRSLVPSLTPKWNWLRPMRSLSAVTSGAFLMVFLVAAVAQSGSDLGGGPASPFSRGAPAAAQPGSAPTAAADAGAATAELKVATTESPAPAAAPAALASTAAPAAVQEERAGEGTPSTAFGTTGGTAEDTAAREELSERTRTGLALEPPSPLIWLGLSLVAAALAFAAHWRLRAA